MNDITIKTNRHWNNFLYSYEVPESILADQFDYMDNVEDGTFLKYKGYYYSLDCFMRGGVEGWQGSHGDSYFSGTLINISDDGEQYQIASYSC